MPTYTFRGQTPNDGTFEVGTGPFPDLPAGNFVGNFYGNDPRLGLVQAGDQKYSLPDSERDASSSGNTFKVGTGPQPNLPAGRFLPGQIAGALRGQAQAAAAATRASQPPPPQVSPTPIAGSAIPAQTTLPNPVTPVAVPTFVPSTGLPNFGSSNLLAQTSVPGAAGGLPNVPNIVSPLQPLLETPSTLPATGTSVPNINSNLGSQSVFTQLFPSVPDISQQPIATAAEGGPILASDSLPRYESGGEADFPEGEMGSPFSYRPFSYDEGEIEREARRPKILSLLRKYLGEESEFPGLGDKSTSELQGMLDNLRKAMPEGMVELLERGDDRLQPRLMNPFTETPLSKPMDPNDPLITSGRRDDFYMGHDREPFFDTELMMRLQEPGGNEEYARQENLRRALVQSQEADLKGFRTPNYKSPLGRPDLRPGELQGAANGGPILASEYLNAGGPVQYFKDGGTSEPEGTEGLGELEGNVQAAFDEAEDFSASLAEGIFEGTKTRLPRSLAIAQGRDATPDPTASFLGGRTDITPADAAALTPDTLSNLTDQQVTAILNNDAVRNAVPPSAFASEKAARAQNLINPSDTEINFAVQDALRNPITGPQARQSFFNQNNLTGFFAPRLFAEGGPILASDYLNAGGPVQYFNEGQGVSAPDYPGEEPGPPGSAVDYSGSVSSAMSVGPAAGQSNEGETSAFDAAIDYGKSTAKSLGISGLTTPFGPLGYGITAPLAMNSFITGLTDEEGTQATDFAQKAGQVAQQLGLALSKNQAYPGDSGYGLDPDTAFSNQTAFSPTISRYSSDFDVDDPLQGGQ